MIDEFAMDDLENDTSDTRHHNQLDVYTTQKVQKKLAQDGYRIRKGLAEETQLQSGFDDGFKDGVSVGRLAGRLLAACRHRCTSGANHDSMRVIESILMKSLPEQNHLTHDQAAALSAAVNGLSSELGGMLDELLQGVRGADHSVTALSSS